MFYDKTNEPRMTKCDTLKSKKFKKGYEAAYFNPFIKTNNIKNYSNLKILPFTILK